MKYRIERDSLGEVRVPLEALYGPQTARAVANFHISRCKAHPVFIRATAMTMPAAAMANMECGILDETTGNAIIDSSREIIDGRWHAHFVVDVFQTGAGTSHNMNANEVIANRAIELLGGKRGEYSIVSPNDHVNMSQSTNDTFPTSMRIAVLILGEELLRSIDLLIGSLSGKSEEFKGVIKSGRTHLQDAVPMKLGQEFGGYAHALKKERPRLSQALETMKVVGLGATAVGTSINIPPGYRETVVNRLSEVCGLRLKEAPDLFEATQSMGDFACVSSSLKNLSLEITRIANDIRLLSSGPWTGLAGIVLPPVQPADLPSCQAR